VNPIKRRHLLALAATWALPAAARRADVTADPVRRGRPLVFPRDHGTHLGARTEWWYVTGWLGGPEAPTHGFQVTFFRSRTGLAHDLPGRLAPRHLLFAHAAVTDLTAGRHRHDQRLLRWNGEPPAADAAAGATTGDARVWIGPWSMHREGDAWRARVRVPDDRDPWSLELRLQRTQPLLLQGDAGFSRKGPEERQASHYYSEPQLAARAALVLGRQRIDAEGRAWLDHEWSDEILATDAVGWDWIGINLFDGGALTAFQLRRRDGSALWTGGSLRRADGQTTIFDAADLRWRPGRRWRSAATGADYPLDWQIDSPAGRWRVRALLDAQELDHRQGTGTVYWEGLSELLDEGGRRIGLGYLELTGYAGVLRL
jgi:predicted secreted hydrolase